MGYVYINVLGINHILYGSHTALCFYQQYTAVWVSHTPTNSGDFLPSLKRHPNGCDTMASFLLSPDLSTLVFSFQYPTDCMIWAS